MIFNLLKSNLINRVPHPKLTCRVSLDTIPRAKIIQSHAPEHLMKFASQHTVANLQESELHTVTKKTQNRHHKRTTAIFIIITIS
jgi:sugar/nucleoside kinase (ribokinase family)